MADEDEKEVGDMKREQWSGSDQRRNPIRNKTSGEQYRELRQKMSKRRKR